MDVQTPDEELPEIVQVEAVSDPDQLISALLHTTALDATMGTQAATRIRRGQPTICDLIIGATWLDISPAALFHSLDIS